MAFGLFTSTLATVATLPERAILAPILSWRGRRAGDRLDHKPGVVVVLGYFRSGTTHLHYLLSCDRRFRTPTWCETLAPQGWALTWAFLRIFMIPFISAKRPQDDVAIGPDWPAEDDFACNNWALASSLPSRFIVPALHGHYARFHALHALTPRELSRWRRAQSAFLRKLAWLSPRRAILLKSPSHTARVAELVRMLGGRDGRQVKVVHISRDPAAVIRSNTEMAHRLGIYNLQDPQDSEDVRQRILEEYLHTEEKYIEESAALPEESRIEVRYEDLVADPLGTLRLVYRSLSIPWSSEYESRVTRYLSEVRDYRASNRRDAGAARAVAAQSESAQASRLQALVHRFGHDQPPVPATALQARAHRRASRGGVALSLMIVLSIALMMVWLMSAWIFVTRFDWLIWPIGVVLGWAGIRTAGGGSTRLGLTAAVITLTTYVAFAWPGTFLADYGQRGAAFATPERPTGYHARPGEPAAFWGLSPWITMDRWEWSHINRSARRGMTAQNNAFWLLMGVVTAYRFASRRHLNPPGRG